MTGVILALSPHLDDAVFSAGGSLAARAARGHEVIVVTAFSGDGAQPTGFALDCQLDKGLGPDVDYMALRRAEDNAACEALGVRAIHLPLPEAPHRGYDSADALFGPPRADDPISQTLLAACRGLLDMRGLFEIWAPRALGGHVDHVLLHRAIRAALRDSRREGLARWWTDWPYADRVDPADPEAETVTRLPWRETALPSAERARKADACAAYRSQLGFQFGGETALRARLAALSRERFAMGKPSPLRARFCMQSRAQSPPRPRTRPPASPTGSVIPFPGRPRT